MICEVMCSAVALLAGNLSREEKNLRCFGQVCRSGPSGSGPFLEVFLVAVTDDRPLSRFASLKDSL